MRLEVVVVVACYGAFLHMESPCFPRAQLIRAMESPCSGVTPLLPGWR